MTYRIMMTSWGGTRKELYTGLTEKEAYEICESCEWVFDTGYIWDLEIEEED